MIPPGTLIERPADLSRYVLAPTAKEIAETRVLFLARHATDTSAERQKKYGYFVVYNATVLRVLQDLGLNVTPASDLDVLFGPLDFDFIYSIHHHETFEGHELLASAVAAYRGVPCLGGAAPLRAVGEDKVLAKRLAASLGIEVADHRLVDPRDPAAAEQAPPGRWILKPRSGVASDTILRGDGKTDWKKALAAAAHPKHGGRAFIAESFVPGLNLTVPMIEGFPAHSFDVFEEKGRAGDNILTSEGKEGRKAEYASGPYLGPGAEEAAAAAAKLAAELSPFDYARFDFRYDPDKKRLVFLEVNLACNLSPAGVVARAAALRGISYHALLGHVFAYSLRRQQARVR